MSKLARNVGVGAIVVALVGAAAAFGLRSRGEPVSPPSGSATAGAEVDGPREVVEWVFDGKLAPGWEDWGFGRHDYEPGQPVKIAFAGYGAIIFHHSELPSRFGGVSFRYKAPEQFGSFLQVVLQNAQPGQKFPRVDVTERHTKAAAEGWKEVWIPWSQLNPNGAPFDRLTIRARTIVGPELVSLDRVGLTAPSGPVVVKAVRKARVSIDCSKPARRISPLIYGVADRAAELGAPMVRIGGNTMSRLNWDIGNVWNTGSDWYFRNVSSPTGLSDWLASARKDGIQVAMVVPMLGWVAKDGTSFSFPKSRFGPQRAHDPELPEAGDGVKPDGTPIRPGPPTLTSVAASPELIGRWIAKIREQDAANKTRSIHMYILDNEPMLWHVTHRDVHPDPAGYDELLERTIAYGTAIRKADPEAVIAGPAEWGWSAYFFSAKDLAPGAVFHPDRAAHGGVPLLPWYLGKLAEHEKKTGTRILDVLDVHFYPQAKDVYSDKPGDEALVALRLRTTRALWDETYRDESWIGEHIQLLPRLRKWVDGSYPGRGISIGEWSFGAETHVSGALAIAETLGRFGQHGLTSAFYWRAPPAGSAGAQAFRLYRNYDGKGAKFGDYSLSTRDAPGLSLFAARDESKKKLTAVLLNLDPHSNADVELSLSSCGQVENSRMVTFKEGPARLDVGPSAVGTLIPQRLAARSFGLIEISTR